MVFSFSNERNITSEFISTGCSCNWLPILKTNLFLQTPVGIVWLTTCGVVPTRLRLATHRDYRLVDVRHKIYVWPQIGCT